MPENDLSTGGSERLKAVLYACPSPDCLVALTDPYELEDHINEEHEGEWDGPDWPKPSKYCRVCGWVEPAEGFHPEYGPTDHCPNGGFDHPLFDSRESMIETDHENALLQTDRELTYL